MIRRRLIKKYNMYYSFWIDYSILTAVFSMIGLFIAIVEWEFLYPVRQSKELLQ